MAKRAKLSRNVLIFAALAAIAVTLFLAFRPTATEVDLGEVRRGDLTVTIVEEGRTKVTETYMVSTPVAGRLLRVQFHPGDTVIKRETVVAKMRPINPVVLDSRTREQATAALNGALAALRVAQADLNAAAAAEELARFDFDRTKSLFESGISSEVAMQRAKGALQTSQARLETAKASIQMREAEVAKAQANLVGFDALGLENINGNAPGDEIPIYSPIDGRVLRVLQESETTLPVGAPIMEIGDIASGLEVEVELISSDAVQVTIGDRVILRDWGGAGDLQGKVRRIDPYGVTKYSALGVEEQRVRVEITLLTPSQDRPTLGHGYRLEAAIIIWQASDILTVPANALFREQGQWSVFVAENGIAQMRVVEVGKSNGIYSEVLSGLVAGDKVVLYPSAAIESGSTIAARTQQSAN